MKSENVVSHTEQSYGDEINKGYVNINSKY